MSARYWVAQHVEDLFRNEPQNVGVFVRVGDRVAAKFFGEVDDGAIDGRKIRSLPYPEVYRQWVECWRDRVASGGDGFAKASGAHYRVVEAGAVSDIEHDSAEDVASYLYSLLVSEGRFKEAIQTCQEDDGANHHQSITLEDDFSAALKRIDILSENGSLLVRHPIRRNVPVQGKSVSHRPAFVQDNGSLCVMETVDFSSSRKKWSLDHAGFSAYMFRDIRETGRNAEPIAIVRIQEGDEDNSDIMYGLSLLKNEATIINWSNKREQDAFLSTRKRVAISS